MIRFPESSSQCVKDVGERSELFSCEWNKTRFLFIKLTNIMSLLRSPGHQSEFIWSKPVGAGWYHQLGVLSWSLSFGPEKNSWDTVERTPDNNNGNHTIWQDQQSWGVPVVRDPNRDPMEYYPDQVNDPKGTLPRLDSCRLVLVSGAGVCWAKFNCETKLKVYQIPEFYPSTPVKSEKNI